MPYSVSFAPPKRFTIIQTGVIPASESRAAFGEVASHPSFQPGSTLLTIVSGATSVPAADELAGIAATLKTLADRGLAAFVIVTEPGYVFGVARMFSAASDMLGIRVEVVQDMDEAHRMLDEVERQASRKP